MVSESSDKLKLERYRNLASLLKDEHCSYIRLYDIDGIFDYAQAVLITNVRSLTHLGGLTDRLPDLLDKVGMSEYAQYCLKRSQVKRMGEWVIHDLKDLVLHLFIPSSREYYNLDSVFFQAATLYSYDE